MKEGSVFENNRTQSVRLPKEVRFPKGTNKVSIRVVGQDRIISPTTQRWNSFFLNAEGVSEDFMESRGSQEQVDRESFVD